MTRGSFATGSKPPTLPQKLGSRDASPLIFTFQRDGSQVLDILGSECLVLLKDMYAFQREEKILTMMFSKVNALQKEERDICF